MKKLIKHGGIPITLLKFDLKMKLTTFFLIVSLFQTYANSYSQNTKITLDLNKVKVERVLDEIESLTEFKFFVDTKKVNLERIVTVKENKERISKILEKIFKNTNVSFEVFNKQIILKTNGEDKNQSLNIDLEKSNAVQQREISGIVTDNDGMPLPGASVIVKGTDKGTTTDFDGNFTLKIADETTILIVSFMGYGTREISINNQTNLNIQLLPEAAALDEVVVVGYGSLSRSKVLGAVSSIKSDDISQLPVGGVDEALSGRISGVQVVSSGTPGGGSEIKIRGVGTITAGRSPLIVVDGYPLTEGSDLNAVNPLDIESIEVLKDAASTAIYGSRGANGVIMITTKEGKTDEISINFDTYSGFQKVLNPMKFLDAYQFAQVVKEARDWGYISADPTNRSENDDTATRLANGASPRHIIPSNFDKYLAGTPGLTNNNWLNDVFQDGRIESHNISVSGKSDNTKWFVSGGYFNQEGLIIGSGYDRYSAKVNIETKFNDKIRFGINLSPSISNKKAVIEGWADSPMQQAILSEPFFTPYNDEGNLNISQQIRWHINGGTDGALAENPVAIALRRKDETSKFRLFGNTFVEVDIIEGLTFKTQFGGDFDYSLREQFRPSTIGAYRMDVTAAVPWAKEKTKTRRNWISENTLNYTKNIEEHSLNLLAGYSYQKENYESTYVNAPVLNSNDITNIAGATTTTTSKEISDWVMISYFGRIQYDYDSKYLFIGSLRRDGSSRFGADNKFGVFPSLSGGWIVSNEDFFPEESIVNKLKFRYSWGKTGNNQIGNYASISLLNELNGYIDGDLAPGQIPNSSPNSGLSWETTVTNNFGFDLGLFNSKLNLGVDYFISKTEDMLLKVPVPQQSGFTTSLQNIGKMENNGIEIGLSSANINLGEVTWNSSINFSKINNKVVALAPGQDQIISGGTNITKVGNSIGEFYGYVVDGIYKSQAEIDASAQSGTTVRVGDWRIVDVDGNGSINSDDRDVIGSPLPDFTYGFNNRFSYKNFDVNVFIDGVSGVDVLSRTVRNATNGQGFSNQLAWYYENRWHPQNNPNGTLARPDYTQSSERGKANVSSAFIEDGSFLRVRNITLGYNLPNTLSSKLGMAKLRVYATLKNPIMITDFKGYNPEQSNSNPLDPSDTEAKYPQNKSFVLGLNVSF